MILQYGAIGGRRKTRSWLCRDPNQLWRLVDPGWHLTWVHEAEQGLGEWAESQISGLHESNHSGSQLFLKRGD